MIFPLFRRSARPDTISSLYGTIVAQARLPGFYRNYAVPDTVNGRFDLIVLHLALLLERLAAVIAERLRNTHHHVIALLEQGLRIRMHKSVTTG